MGSAGHGCIDEGYITRNPAAQFRQEARRQCRADDQSLRILRAREQSLTIETQLQALRHIPDDRDDDLHATGEFLGVFEHTGLEETELTGGTDIESPDFIAGVL